MTGLFFVKRLAVHLVLAQFSQFFPLDEPYSYSKFLLVLGFLLITCNLMHQALRCSFNALDLSKNAMKIIHRINT